jgi:hypothetical protein
LPARRDQPRKWKQGPEPPSSSPACHWSRERLKSDNRDGSVVSSLHCMNDPQPEGHMASHIERRKFLASLGGAAGAGAAAGPAGDWLPQWSVGRGMGQLYGCISQRFERKRLHGFSRERSRPTCQ